MSHEYSNKYMRFEKFFFGSVLKKTDKEKKKNLVEVNKEFGLCTIFTNLL